MFCQAIVFDVLSAFAFAGYGGGGPGGPGGYNNGGNRYNQGYNQGGSGGGGGNYGGNGYDSNGYGKHPSLQMNMIVEPKVSLANSRSSQVAVEEATMVVEETTTWAPMGLRPHTMAQ